MIVETDFLTHWKTRMLVAELGDKSAPLYVLALWLHCQQRKTDTFDCLSLGAIKAICQCEHDGILEALEKCGFIHIEGDKIVVHGWAETNAQLIANWENGAKGGRKSAANKQRNRTKREPIDNPSETQIENGLTHSEPNANPSSTDRVDKSRVDKRRINPLPPLPIEVDCQEFRAALETWMAYKGGKYKPQGVKALIAIAAKRAKSHGVPAVVAAMERAIANGWKGWDQDSSFPPKKPPDAIDSRVPTDDDDANWTPHG